MLDWIESLKGPAIEEAKRLFPHHPKAQEVWVKLKSHSGGIDPVVQTLGLHHDFELYQKEFKQSVEKGLLETASMQVNDFIEFCKQKLLEEFYMFK